MVPKQAIEDKLNVIMPDDWAKISNFYKGQMLNALCLFSPDYQGKGSNIVTETIRYRNTVNLPNKYVFLGRNSYNFVLLKTKTALEKAQILYGDILDIEKLGTGEKFEHYYEIFPSFIVFFECMLNKEEKLIVVEKLITSLNHRIIGEYIKILSKEDASELLKACAQRIAEIEQ